MFVITKKTNDVCLMFGEQLDYMDNGYPRIIDYNIAFRDEDVNVYEAVVVPEDVQPEKYCYTPADGFYPNPNYQEPNEYGIPDELVTRIKNDAVTEIEEAVTNGTDE